MARPPWRQGTHDRLEVNYDKLISSYSRPAAAEPEGVLKRRQENRASGEDFGATANLNYFSPLSFTGSGFPAAYLRFCGQDVFHVCDGNMKGNSSLYKMLQNTVGIITRSGVVCIYCFYGSKIV